MSATEYERLITSFLNDDLELDDLVTQFNDSFLNEPGGMDETLFWILEEAFESIESCYPETPYGQDTVTEISVPKLREELTQSIRKLNDYLAQEPE